MTFPSQERGGVELKPCPFCGESDVEYIAGDGHWPRVQCQECGASGPSIDLAKSEAIRRWNTRAALQPGAGGHE